MSRTPPPPGFPDPASVWAVRSVLEAAGFREDVIAAGLGVGRWSDAASLGRWDLLERAERLGSPLDALFLLFRLGVDVGEAELRAGVGEVGLGALLATGMVRAEGGRVHAQVSLGPVGEAAFAWDLAALHDTRAPDFVVGAGGATLRTRGYLPPDPVDAALDLGCGSGILAGAMSGRARRVVATDVNERAVAFARFNARLNGFDNVECRVGSLFAPVGGERFDLIVTNPPYVLSPEPTFVYRDGEEGICRSIVRAAERHLAPSGHLLMLAEWPERAEEEWSREPSDWLGDAAVDAWLLRLYTEPVGAYATRWLNQEYRGDPPREAYRAWVEHLRRQGVSSVGGGLLVLRPARAPRPSVTSRDAPGQAGDGGASLWRWLRCQEWLQDHPDDRSLLDLALTPAPDLEREDRRSVTAGGWEASRPRLVVRAGFRFGARVDPVAAEIVGLLDGERTPREALALLAGRTGVPADHFTEGLPEALRRLVDLGLLVPGRTR